MLADLNQDCASHGPGLWIRDPKKQTPVGYVSVTSLIEHEWYLDAVRHYEATMILCPFYPESLTYHLHVGCLGIYCATHGRLGCTP
jgi:hypothetical protein